MRSESKLGTTFMSGNNRFSTQTLAKIAAKSMLAAGLMLATLPSLALPQHTTAIQPAEMTPHRTRLILKDGSYQIVMSYRITGSIVHYVSAERGGAEEDIPLDLVDLEATRRY